MGITINSRPIKQTGFFCRIFILPQILRLIVPFVNSNFLPLFSRRRYYSANGSCIFIPQLPDK
jgi:ABC-type amino acid transport system permease subunit